MLSDLIHGNLMQAPARGAGRPRVLSDFHENLLAHWILRQQAVGCSVEPIDVRKKAASLQILQGLPHDVASMPLDAAVLRENDSISPKDGHWYQRFIQRFPFLSLRTPSTLAASRVGASNPVVVKSFYNLFQGLLQKRGWHPGTSLQEGPMVWNMDESFVNLSKRAGNRRVLASMGSKNAYRPGSTYSKHITIIACVNNYGEYIPPGAAHEGGHVSGRISG